ncbi:MAG: glycosyltransferase family 4 protein [Deltaproteobacteria bacterium]|nr:glycosyltransferase family 4 protein [Deltaproteobacteria bacterium]
MPAEKIFLNRLFVDTDRYRPLKDRLVLSVGRFTERKGFRYLMQAASILKDEPVHFVVVGFGPLDVGALAYEMDVEEKVTIFHKLNQEQLRLLYQKADIYCLPSITTDEEGTEGIPVVLMEAMACGLPVVSTRCGAVEELVEEILVPERDPAALADGIRQIIGSDELADRYGKRNREIVMEKFSEDNIRLFMSNILSMLNP